MQNKTSISRLGSWFNKLPIEDPIDRQMAALVQILLIGLMFIILAAGGINLVIQTGSIPWQANLLRTFIFVAIIGIPLALLRQGYFRGSVMLIIAILLFLETYAVLASSLRSIAETLSFFTLAIILAGSLLSRRVLWVTFAISATCVFMSAYREPDPAVREDAIVIAANFILLNSLISLLLDRFRLTLRSALSKAMERERKLDREMEVRHETEAALQKSTSRLEVLHEIDRALLTVRTHREIATTALARIRELIPCPRASVSLLDTAKQEAAFLAMDSDTTFTLPMTPISFAEFGQQTIDDLLQNKPSIIDDSLSGPNVTELDMRLAKIGIRSWVCLPLFSQGQLVGSLNLGRGAGEKFTTEEVESARDISNQLALAIQQANLYQALREELAERKKLISQLETNNAELERFTYTVSHDLRSPLVTIKGFLGMLNKDIESNRSDRVHDDFRRISNATDKMDALLSDLLELSRIGRIINPPEEVNVSELVHEAVETLDARIRSNNIHINISPDLPILYGDRIRLREVFENLIDNAAKYMGDQPRPTIEIGVRAGNESVIFVRDNGMGIEPSYAKKIFGLFEKLNPRSEGTGIGLALLKRIVEVHGGKIWVESEGSGKGSTFCFTIPDGRNNPK
jgi:signal transduction histidine kinase